MVVTLDQQYNVGEKTTVLLYTFVAVGDQQNNLPNTGLPQKPMNRAKPATTTTVHCYTGYFTLQQWCIN